MFEELQGTTDGALQAVTDSFPMTIRDMERKLGVEFKTGALTNGSGSALFLNFSSAAGLRRFQDMMADPDHPRRAEFSQKIFTSLAKVPLAVTVDGRIPSPSLMPA